MYFIRRVIINYLKKLKLVLFSGRIGVFSIYFALFLYLVYYLINSIVVYFINQDETINLTFTMIDSIFMLTILIITLIIYFKMNRNLLWTSIFQLVTILFFAIYTFGIDIIIFQLVNSNIIFYIVFFLLYFAILIPIAIFLTVRRFLVLGVVVLFALLFLRLVGHYLKDYSDHLEEIIIMIIVSAIFIFIIKFFIETIIKPIRNKLEKSCYVFISKINNDSVVIPFYDDCLEEFVPIKVDSEEIFEKEKVSERDIGVYGVQVMKNNESDKNQCGFYQINNDTSFIIPKKKGNHEVIFKIKESNKEIYYKIIVKLDLDENVISVKKSTLKKIKFFREKLSFLWFKRFIVLYPECFKKIWITAKYNQRFGEEKVEMKMKSNEFIGTYIDADFGKGKTLLSRMISEKYDVDINHVTPIEVGSKNVNYDIFEKCTDNELHLFGLAHYLQNYLFWIYIFIPMFATLSVLSLLDIKTLNYLPELIIWALILILFNLLFFPKSLIYRNHSNLRLNSFYIDVINTYRFNTKQVFIIENFDRQDYENFENLFILMNGISNKYSSEKRVMFIINALRDNIPPEKRENFLYSIDKHCIEFKYNLDDNIDNFFNSMSECIKIDFDLDDSNIKIIDELKQKTNKVISNLSFRDVMKLTSNFRDEQSLSEIEEKYRLNTIFVSMFTSFTIVSIVGTMLVLLDNEYELIKYIVSVVIMLGIVLVIRHLIKKNSVEESKKSNYNEAFLNWYENLIKRNEFLEGIDKYKCQGENSKF